MNYKRLLRRSLVAILFAIFLCSAAVVIYYAVRSQREQRAFEALASFAEAEAEKASATSSAFSEAEPAFLPAGTAEEASYISPYLPLKERNEDFFGWLSIEGTHIDYPVMYTPDDPTYYLRRAFDKSASWSGVPFMDAACFADCGNYLIHGHNMQNGTMFADLLNYAEQAFWEAHPRIQFDTLAGTGSYSVLAAFYTEIDPLEEDGFRYYQYTDLRDAADFDAYLTEVKAAALYDTGVTAVYGDALLTLSTCSYQTTNGRFVVVARKD